MSENAAIEGARRPVGVLVLGLGNVLLGDDGVGAAALTHLERNWRIPPGVRLEDGGTLGLSLLGLLAEAERVILVDAVRTDDPPGTLVRLAGDDVMDTVRDRLSPHQVGVADLLEVARLTDCYPAAVTLLGVVPETIEMSVERSRAVEHSIDELTAAIIGELQGLGYEMVPETNVVGRHRPIHDLARHFGM
jgi:hydrogenase maturation protease